ncbi:hypothetical protein KEM56_005478, partial [Ascosphaera pollenicola]
YGNVYYAAPTQAPAPEPVSAPANVALGSSAAAGPPAPLPAISYESKKRGYDALNEFFGDIKRRQIDPTSYQAVGQRLMSLQGLPLPISTGMNVGMNVPMMIPYSAGAGGGSAMDYTTPSPSAPVISADGNGGGYNGLQHFNSAGHYAPAPNAAQSVSMPQAQSAGATILAPGTQMYYLPQIRTKSDLLSIDSYLEQMQNTVYTGEDGFIAAAMNGATQQSQQYGNGGSGAAAPAGHMQNFNNINS